MTKKNKRARQLHHIDFDATSLSAAMLDRIHPPPTSTSKSKLSSAAHKIPSLVQLELPELRTSLDAANVPYLATLKAIDQELRNINKKVGRMRFNQRREHAPLVRSDKGPKFQFWTQETLTYPEYHLYNLASRRSNATHKDTVDFYLARFAEKGERFGTEQAFDGVSNARQERRREHELLKLRNQRGELGPGKKTIAGPGNGRSGAESQLVERMGDLAVGEGEDVEEAVEEGAGWEGVGDEGRGDGDVGWRNAPPEPVSP